MYRANHHSLRSVLSAALIPLIAVGGPALAQPNAAGTGKTADAKSIEEQLRPIEDLSIEELLNLPVVTASGGKAQTQALAAANVVVIQHDEIALHGWRSIADVLENVPGLYLVNDLVVPSLGVRGVTGGPRAGTRIVKVMINSVAVNFRPDLTAFLGPEFIPIEAVERVEIAKGPLSSLYGANAFLATVNVITLPNGSGPRSQAAARGYLVHGRPGFGGSAMLRQGNEHFGLLLSVTSERLDRSGLTVAKTFDAQDPSLPRYASFFGHTSANDLALPVSVFGHLAAQLGEKNRITLQGGLQQLDSNGEFQLNSVLTGQSRLPLFNAWSNLSAERRWSDAVSSQVMISLSTGRPTGDERLWLTGTSNSSFQRNFRYWALDGTAKVSITPNEQWSIDVGADASYEPQRTLFYSEIFNVQFGSINPGDRIDLIGADAPRNVLLEDVGMFAQASYAPTPDLQFTGNARIDFSNLFDSQVSFRAAAAYRWTSAFSTKLIAGRSFQNPSAVLLYGQPGFGSANNIVGNRVVAGLQPLQPQSALSLEAVAATNVSDRALVEVAAFVQQVSNKIIFKPAGADFRAENQGDESYAGVELRSRGSFGRFVPYLDVAFQRSLQVAGVSAQYPDLWARGGFDLDLPEAFLRLNLQGRAASARGASESNVRLNNKAYTLPAYAVVDASLASSGLHLITAELETRLTLAARNLLDDRASEPGFGGFDVPNLGRTVMLEVRQDF